MALALALSVPARAQKDIVKRAECPDGMGIYLTAKNKVLLGLPEELMGRKLLLGGAVTAVSDPGAANIGQRASGPLLCVIPTLEDSLVVLSRPQVAGSSADGELALAMERNFSAPVLKKLPVLGRQGGRVLFDVTALITKAAPRGNDFKPGSEDGTSWYSDLKAFQDNASIRLNQSLEANGLGGKTTVSLVSTVSVLALPEQPMQPKLQDARIGTFYTGSLSGGNRFRLSTQQEALRPYRLANRWRVEPADTEAWLKGQPVPVKKPIVWYVDDSFPSLWKDPVKRGILAWNAAFEAIGLKDVLQVRDFPADDPAFDPENLRYNCIRFVPNTTSNAMGPSWADPETGEIVSAQVLVFSDVTKLLGAWRFVQTAQVDPRVRARKLPDDVLQEALVYVVSHEIGHTLGLLHNMAGSAAIPVDSLRSPSFTAVHGTTASIMDYARFNYVAQPSDTLVRLVPPSLGVYDRYAIAWLYRPFPGGDMWEEAAAAEAFLDAHEGDPFYRYGPQQPSMAPVQYDPSARTQDLGDNPILAGNYGIANLQYILPNLQEWISQDPDYSYRKHVYGQLCTQFSRYLGNVEALVGGVYLYKTKSGLPAVPVEAALQREALKWVVDQVRACQWIDCPSLTRHFGLSSGESHKIASAAATYLAGAAPLAVATASLSGSTYAVEDYFEDLFDAVFSGKLTPQQKSLQRALVSQLVKKGTPAAALPSAQERKLDEVCFGEAQVPTQGSVDVSASSEVNVYSDAFLGRVKKYCRSRRSNAHFAYLYKLIP